jgi:hypothetical protein
VWLCCTDNFDINEASDEGQNGDANGHGVSDDGDEGNSELEGDEFDSEMMEGNGLQPVLMADRRCGYI